MRIFSFVQEESGAHSYAHEEVASKVKTRTVAIDFSAPTEENYGALASACTGLDIGILGMRCSFCLKSPLIRNDLS